tara:strand:+ start:5132 stop:6106 length:975 start_codon:yes stop_codon:yes gene_type:complete
MKNKTIFLQDSDELICDIKAACKSTIETIGFNQIKTSKGLVNIYEGTVLDYYHTDEIGIVSNELIKERIESALTHFKEPLKIDDFYHTLSMRQNFRKKIDINYKKKENKQFNSFANPEIRNYILENEGQYDKTNNPKGKVFVGSNLEADDRIGIAATYFYNKFTKEGYNVKIIVSSQDKDMKTIPNIWIYNHKTNEMKYNSYEDAIRFWFNQILMGDRADGIINYPQGFGKDTAPAFINKHWDKGLVELYRLIKLEYTNNNFLCKETRNRVYKNIESQCLINAQLLRILTIDFFDTITQEPILFQESHIEFLQEQLNRELQNTF